MSSTSASLSQSLTQLPSRAEQATSPSGSVSRRALWAGRIMSGFAVLFLGFDATMKLLLVAEAVQGTEQLGWPVSVIRPLGIVQAVCLLAYLWPPSAVLGAVLWTGYLGGAIATHVRVGDPLFSHVLFPVYVALFLWGGLWLRDRRVRALLPFSDRRGTP